MGKGGDSSLTTSASKEPVENHETPVTPVKPSDRLISWDEVKKHATKGDSWFVIEGNVYDTSRFARVHPGGHVITHWQGQDATEAWRAMHTDFEKVGRYMKPLRIGRVLEDTMNSVQKGDLALVTEFEKFRLKCVELGFFKPSVFFFICTVGQLVVFEVLGYLMLSYFGIGWVSWLLSAVLLASGQAQGGWSQHDFGHLSVFKSVKLNHFVHWFTMCFMKGASTDWWNHMHNQHHSKTNVINKDPDVRLDTFFVLGDVIPKRVAEKRKSLMPFNWQQSYFFVIGPPLLFPIFFQIMTIRHPMVQKRYIDLAVMVFFYMRWFYMFVPILGLVGFLKFYFFIRIIESHWFVWVTQSNHIPMDIEDDKERCWFQAQIHTTCNVEANYFNTWFTGHLNYQVEHHLFPTMPRCNLHKTTKMIQEMCKKHDIDFQSKTISTAFIDIVKSLKHSGEIWYAYYYSVAQTEKQY